MFLLGGEYCLEKIVIMCLHMSHMLVLSRYAEFQRVMDQVLSGLPFARCYIDDVIIFSKTP